MAYLLCRRYRRCEYYWTIALLVTLVFLYTCLYSVHTGAKEGQPEDVVWRRSRRESEHVAAPYQGEDGDSDNDAIDDRSLIRKALVGSFASPATIITASSNPVAEHKVINKIEDKAVTEKDNTIMKMREQVDKMNKDEVVLNEDKFPSFDLVMIVQVHRRTEYLKMLVESLRNARDISKVLLVVSFDYYDEELFSVVDKIDICKVIILLFLVG